MTASVVTSKGQTTIPKSVRDRLRLRTGDRIEFVVQDDGTALLIPRTYRLADLAGVLPPAPHSVTVEEMNEAVEAGAAARYARSRR